MYYNSSSESRFDSKMIAITAEKLSEALRIRGPHELTDYGPKELDSSWRMQKLADDLIWALQPERNEAEYYHTGLTFQSLGEMGYKNTKLIDTALEKLL